MYIDKEMMSNLNKAMVESQDYLEYEAGYNKKFIEFVSAFIESDQWYTITYRVKKFEVTVSKDENRDIYHYTTKVEQKEGK